MTEKTLLKRKIKAIKENNESLIVNICTDLGKLYMDEGRYNNAITEFSLVADVYKKQNKLLEYAVANRGIGDAYVGLRKIDDALKHQHLYLDTVKQLNNKVETQRALASIGHTYISSYLDLPDMPANNLNLANKYFKNSLIVCNSLSEQISKLDYADMLARLYSNLGLVQECLENYDNALELITKAINLCKANDIYEQLQRCYMSLGSLHEKKQEYNIAIQQYNLAIETSKKLKNKSGMMMGALSAKADVLLKLSDLHRAKSALIKAYKLKISNVKDQKLIERNLRSVVVMCLNEDKLLTADNTNYRELKRIYENMGDAACSLKLYTKAIDYYKKMLESAERAGLNNSELATCYYSLAETYKDNCQYDEAVKYYEMELALCQTLKDSLNTLSKIADTKETANCVFSEVREVYDKAIEKCRLENNSHEEGRMLKRCINYLRRQNRHLDAFELEKEFSTLDYISSDSDDNTNSEDVQSTPEIGEDICLQELTDMSEDSDCALSSPTKGRRRRPKTFQLRRNMKGETQLHTACISGKINIVRHLLDQGHPVNIRDHCGWLPLHEACINGHYEIVSLLLDRGAAINDRGGTHCNGITPLHDAAFNGHLSVVQLLLNRGASVVAKTDDGETILQILQKWRNSVELQSNEEDEYNLILKQVSLALEKVGHVQTTLKPILSVSQTNRDNLKKLCDLDEPSTSTHNKSTDDYKNVMKILRHKSTSVLSTSERNVKRSALLSDEDVIDDWLEDDLAKSKRRRTNSADLSAKSPNKATKRQSKSPKIQQSPIAKRKSNSFKESRNDLSIEIDSDYENDFLPTRNLLSVKNRTKRTYQTKLTNLNYTKNVMEADSTSSGPVKQRSSSLPLQSPDTDPTLTVDIKIDGKLYRIPVLLSQLNTHTIRWLADQAASRYAKKEYIKPVLELETASGAVLADDDLISLLFPMGATQSEPVVANVVKWNLLPLVTRYREACNDLELNPNKNLVEKLEQLSINLNLANMGLITTTLAPFCKALNRQSNLIDLNLSGNYFNTESVQYLCSSLASLKNLQKLNLSFTGFSFEYLNLFANCVEEHNLSQLVCLDLSNNFIDDQCFKSLGIVTRNLRLKNFNLSYNNLTGNLFSDLNEDVRLNLDCVEQLDISNNTLTNNVIRKFVEWLRPLVIKSLNISRNSINQGCLGQILTILLKDPNDNLNLEVLKSSGCHIQDSEIFDLLLSCEKLKVVDLSYNDLSAKSLKRLLQKFSIQDINLIGCDNILESCNFSGLVIDSCEQNRIIKITVHESSEKEELLINVWKKMYDKRAVVRKIRNLLQLSVSSEPM